MTLIHERLTAQEIESLTSKVALVDPNLSPECRSLLSRLGAAPNSAMSFRRALFAYSEFGTTVFDPAVHEDYDTVFHLCHHFLRMIESPSCPISRSQRERTAATFTSFPILNNIFMPHMHEISFKWVEVLTESCENTKLDGLASSLLNNHPVIVVEFAGGISTHSKAKLLSDTKKIYDCCKQAITKKNLSDMHVVLYYNNVLSLEKVAKVENQFVRKCFAQIKCPKDIVQLKKFVEDMPVIFSWRNSVLSSL
ncbi:hypothetical protein EDC96DRAFT_532473 [Choanephora cucurbitarum]|nr:hypothetical protein EDC96DRAFT_532473 [Choanephora cucurbitarum]